ncbi:DltD N-terminal domain protein [Lentithecium fluviatile CBS 122367]|uniref:DltD N-terminal domain protein n=1 Tax=Lentithecium fluviatile CBS 122367 TaxID=1168545 RepID=A0A6G1J479_9PLEO|nr:DltD N-terminal domain protein [Lentithecium fluviatile CBS 122367]
MSNKQDIEFKTLDGLTLSGWLFPGPQRGPAIIMTPGFNLTKDMIIFEAGQFLNAAGFTVMGYDPRCIGKSDGLPRNDIQPFKNIEDYHDALTYLKTHKHDLVDPHRIAYWGYSFSGAIALCAAALDKRAKAVIACSTLTTWEFSKWKQVLAKAMKDRESQIAGNQAMYLPLLTETGEQPAGFGTGYQKEDVLGIIERHASIEPSFIPRTTLQTYYNMAVFRPMALMKFVNPTPVLLMTGEDDEISPPQLQREMIFDVFQGHKEFVEIPGKAHMDILTGDGSMEVFDKQAEFLHGVFAREKGGAGRRGLVR